MYKHICLMRWKDDASPDEVAEFLAWSRDMLVATQIPFASGSAVSQSGWDWAYELVLDDKEGLAAWAAHASHREMSVRIGGGMAPVPGSGILEKTAVIQIEVTGGLNT